MAMGVNLFISASVLLIQVAYKGRLLAQGCPEMCSCRHSTLWDGKLVNCSFAGLKSVPNVSHIETVTEFYLDHNNISHIDDLAFLGIPRLKKLVLHHNMIKSIDEYAFSDASVMELESLDLSHNHLQSVPKQLPTNLKRLMLSYNDIEELVYVPFVNLHFLEILYLDHNKVNLIRRKSFFSSHVAEGYRDSSFMKRLKKLALNGNSIGVIEDFSFKSLHALQRLTLANNQIEELTKGTFSGLSNLEYLDLRSNVISVIQNGAIGKLKGLKYLYLKHNQLTALPKGLPLLEWFDVSSNFITKVNENDHKDDIYPLDILVIADNPLHCDCHMVWLKELFDRREHLYHFVAGKNSDMIPSCKSPPGVSGETWDLLGDDVFVCSDGEQQPESSEIDLAVLTNGIIQPDTSGATTDTNNRIHKHFMLTDITQTSALLTWRSKQYLKSNSVKIQYYIFENRDTFQSVEVATNDQAYVLQNLVPGSNYIVCITAVESVAGKAGSGISLDQCTEFSTIPDNLIDWEKVSLYLSYSFVLFVKLSVALVMACVIVGTGVVIACLWSCSLERFSHKHDKENTNSLTPSAESLVLDHDSDRQKSSVSKRKLKCS